MFATLDPCLKPLDHFKGARDAASPQDRLREVRYRAQAFRDKMLKDAPVRFYASRSLIRVPYPTKYAFLNAFTLPTPFTHILNRVFIVQVDIE